MITGSPRASEKVHQIGAPSQKNTAKLVETVSASAAALSVGVVNSETLLLNCVFKVDAGTVEVGDAHLVNDNLYAVSEVNAHVAVENALVKVELIDESRASAWLNGQTQTQVVATFLRHQATNLVGGGLGQRDPMGSSFNSGFSHDVILRPAFQLCEQKRLGEDRACENTQVQRLIRTVRPRFRIFYASHQDLSLGKHLYEVRNKGN